ncbi:MAG: hypothetical protein COV75_03265 [Candidatus Omnitrophica bacterium CG11_big_fil_rev_8_21_14_0_20_63_9]|nr:MAG: hypothetical protein COV75_03265 [Candidatus Omnitrophica bacterium CG11_big_fil_rev_8_21_14_0_20_63_9]
MNAIPVKEGTWRSARSGHELWYRCWQPNPARHTLVIVHGFGEHGGRYASLAAELAQAGLCVATIDLWGHGRSSGSRGALEVAGCVADLSELTAEAILPLTGHQRFTIFGHSFGGLVAIWWALHHPDRLQHLVAQSPLLEVGFPIPPWKTALGRAFGVVWPSFSLSMDLDVSALSHDPSVAAAYRADPLVHNTMTAGAYRSILSTRDEVMARAGEFTVPVLLLLGSADHVVSVEMAQQWFDRLRCQKRSVVFPDAYHELHHEGVRVEVLRLTREWVTHEPR